MAFGAESIRALSHFAGRLEAGRDVARRQGNAFAHEHLATLEALHGITGSEAETRAVRSYLRDEIAVGTVVLEVPAFAEPAALGRWMSEVLKHLHLRALKVAYTIGLDRHRTIGAAQVIENARAAGVTPAEFQVAAEALFLDLLAYGDLPEAEALEAAFPAVGDDDEDPTRFTFDVGAISRRRIVRAVLVEATWLTPGELLREIGQMLERVSWAERRGVKVDYADWLKTTLLNAWRTELVSLPAKLRRWADKHIRVIETRNSGREYLAGCVAAKASVAWQELFDFLDSPERDDQWTASRLFIKSMLRNSVEHAYNLAVTEAGTDSELAILLAGRLRGMPPRPVRGKAKACDAVEVE